mmetsp:Transcript_33067/g.47836  ORF Transcript_33067/g.47836 Transcript_33067/m.47836 type:complete len:207 (-) Transcript_33067:199-819(-)|eukprot:CAMPEP_0116010146 /NCGR_PEP_ID=MMETSP0321-20121206/3838_1 /TAXON_ID=163516 /ORGANISM="Leptocylindrus danicus var. danicus, Strain B650" /LENGTH=206 /DNA_ID=CAMNT_0003479211 /DNA_START=256 /DNA_END=876 /DNA_ORIENTATION=-
MKNKEYNESTSYWSRRVQDNPENAISHRYLASLYGESQETLKEQKHLYIALSINPNDIAARNDLALSLFRQGNLKHAEKHFRVILESNGRHSLALNNLAAIFAKRGDYPKARKYCERAIQANPRDALAHRNLSQIRDMEGNVTVAAEHNYIAIEIVENNDQKCTSKQFSEAHRSLSRQLLSVKDDSYKMTPQQCYRRHIELKSRYS